MENKAAISLYEDKMGFESILYKLDEYGKGHDRFIMELEIKDFLKR